MIEHADHDTGAALLFGRTAFYAKFKFDFPVFHVFAQKNTICARPGDYWRRNG
jgi:hypothetical protein